MERLTMRNQTTNVAHLIDAIDNDDINDAIQKLADYEDAEEQGLILRLPCKVGDTVYVLKFEGIWRIIPHQVITLGYIVQLIENEAIGDFVFLTREEAEQVLAEMQKG